MGRRSSDPGLQGGFIWEWVDHGIRSRRRRRQAYWAYGGDFGDVPNDSQLCTDGMIWPDRTPHPAIFEFKELVQPLACKRWMLRPGASASSTNRISLTWAGCAGNGKAIHPGGQARGLGKPAALDAAPRGTLDINIELRRKRVPGAGERLVVNFHFSISGPTRCGRRKGMRVGWEQIALWRGRAPAMMSGSGAAQ